MDPVPAVSGQLQYIMIDWVGGLIVEYSSPCDIKFPYIHLILQLLHMRKKSPIGKLFAISKKFNKSESHCVLHAIFLHGGYPLKWCLSLEIVDNLYQTLSLDMGFMGGIHTICMIQALWGIGLFKLVHKTSAAQGAFPY